jgi:hypothetical protein
MGSPWSASLREVRPAKAIRPRGEQGRRERASNSHTFLPRDQVAPSLTVTVCVSYGNRGTSAARTHSLRQAQHLV